MSSSAELDVLHIGAGRYRPLDRDHVTYRIWSELASGFRSYRVVGRSTEKPAHWSDGNLSIDLLPSWSPRELEFLFTQFIAVRGGIAFEPDVIVCQSPALGGHAALAIARATGARVLMEVHGAEFFAPARFGSRLWLLQALSRHALHRAELIRVQTARMGKELERRYGKQLAPRIRILPPRVDLSLFAARSRRRIASRPLKLLMVGALNPNKGQRRLVRALAGIGREIELHLVGDGPDRAALEQDSKRLNQPSPGPRLVLHGTLPHTAVAAIMRDCDLFVMYSRTEATPRAIMEAMASGLPVITTSAGFCADIVENGREGYVLGPDPDREIVAAIHSLHDNAILAEQMGAAARARAERDYDSTRLFDDYRRLILETAAQ